MTTTEKRLQYIASSPPADKGGFHAETIRAAKGALRLIARLRAAANAKRKRTDR